MEKFFKLKENNTTVRTEIMAGLTTFFAMAYIVFVNPNQVAAEGANGWLAGLGPDIQIAGPESVRSEYREYLNRLLQNYQ